jgi:hypothetical protein
MVGKIFQRSKLIARLTQAVGGVGGGGFFLFPKLPGLLPENIFWSYI